jgi:mannitol-specific phosphotransferase system IIBC component
MKSLAVVFLSCVFVAYLNAVVTVSKVLHGLELLVNNADAGFVGAVYDALDVCGSLAHILQLLVQALGSLNGGLRVEFG